MRFTTRLLPSRRGNVGILLLNNPTSLHALTLDMVQLCQDALTAWYDDESLVAVLVKSSSLQEPQGDSNNHKKRKPAFCAGGDVKSVYLSGQDEMKQGVLNMGQGVPGLGTAEFFRQEYVVNALMATATKPQISLWDGVVMGGGVGISIHGHFRVATEHTLWAMPETAIGLFPDVGSTYWMTRPGRLLSEATAVYLALTGQRLQASDLLYAGLATHYIPSAKLGALETALAEASLRHDSKTDDQKSCSHLVSDVLNSFHENPPLHPAQSMLALQQASIDRAFGTCPLTQPEESFADMMKRWTGIAEDEHKDFCQATSQTLQKMSPTSLCLTLEGLRRGALTLSIQEALRMEFRMMQNCMRPGSNFYEGIRAVLIDKDHQPSWHPDRIDAVESGDIERYFAPIQHEWEMVTSTETGDSSKL